MTPEENKAIETLIQEIEGRKGDSRSATYRDSPALFKIAQLLNKVAIESKDDLKIAFQCNRYLAYQYRSMCRASVAAVYGEAAIKAAKRLLQEHGELLEETEEVFRGLLGDRNRFVDDDCDDLRDLISGLLPEKQIEETEKYREALNCIEENQYVYQLNRAQKEAMRQRLLNADATVVSKLTSMASNLGFDVTVTPKDPHKTSDDSGTEEQEIEVTLKNVDYSKVLEYLIEIHKLDTPIFMRHLNMSRTSALTSNDTKMTVSITLMSYRLKEQNAT